MLLKLSLGVLVVLFVLVLVARKVSSPVHVERTFNATSEVVWKHWTDPESIKRWWGPPGFTAPIIQNDPRTGGRFLLSMKRGDGEPTFNTGHYTEVVPLQRIVSSLSFSDALGNPTPGSEVKFPGVWPDEITVAVEFKSVEGGKTRVAITETGVPLIMKLPAGMGWEQQFDKFEKLF
jgi:uncharacterized protein YndB with AHSA1/START domain